MYQRFRPLAFRRLHVSDISTQPAQYHISEKFLWILLLYNIQNFSGIHPATHRVQQNLTVHTHQRFFKYGIWKSGGAVPLTFNFDIKWEWSASRIGHITRPPPGKSSPLPSEQGVGLVPHLHGRFWRREKFILPISESNHISCLVPPPTIITIPNWALPIYGCIASYYNYEVWNTSNVRNQSSILWVAT